MRYFIKFGLISFFLIGIVSCHKALPVPEPQPQYDPRNISRTETFSSSPVFDIMGNHVVVVWSESDDGPSWDSNFEIMFRERVNGKWRKMQNISNTQGPSLTPQVDIDIHGNIHVVWSENGEICYRMRNTHGKWGNIQYLGHGSIPSVGSDREGNVYVIWQNLGLWYRQKQVGSPSWTEQQGFAHGWADNPSLYVTEGGRLYVVAEGGHSSIRDIYLYEKLPGEGWSEYFNVTNNGSYCWSSSVYGTDEGKVYVSWTEYGINKVGFRIRNEDGTWEDIDTLPDIEGGPWNSFVWGNKDTLIIIWEEKIDNWDIYYRTKINNSFSKRINMTRTSGNSFMGFFPKIINGIIYIVWSDSTDGNFDIFYDEIPIGLEER